MFVQYPGVTCEGNNTTVLELHRFILAVVAHSMLDCFRPCATIADNWHRHYVRRRTIAFETIPRSYFLYNYPLVNIISPKCQKHYTLTTPQLSNLPHERLRTAETSQPDIGNWDSEIQKDYNLMPKLANVHESMSNHGCQPIMTELDCHGRIPRQTLQER